MSEAVFLRRSNIKISVFVFCCRQCRCIFRDQLHLARLEDLLQQLLKCAFDRICELRVPAVEDGKKGNETSDGRTDVDTSNEWSNGLRFRMGLRFRTGLRFRMGLRSSVFVFGVFVFVTTQNVLCSRQVLS